MKRNPDFEPVLDEFRLPLHHGDGGDSAANAGRLAALRWLTCQPDAADFARAYLAIFKKGLLCRHPSQWSSQKDFSGDQTRPIVVASLLYSQHMNTSPGLIFHKSLKSIWYNLKKNYMRYQNGDLFVPHDIALWARIHSWPSVVKLLGDLFLFLYCVYRNVRWMFNRDDVSDDVNLTLTIRALKVISNNSIFISWADEIYNSQWAIDHYFRNSDIPMADLYYLERYMNK